MRVALLVLLLSGCSTIAGWTGASAPVIQAARLADAGKTAADVAAYMKESRSFTDVVVSKALEKDCKLTRLLADESYCIEGGRNDE